MSMSERTEWKLNVAGWILFSFSAVFFAWAALRDGDVVSLAASLLFFVACLIFLIPVWAGRPRSGE